jgi:hypothetical protein
MAPAAVFLPCREAEQQWVYHFLIWLYHARYLTLQQSSLFSNYSTLKLTGSGSAQAREHALRDSHDPYTLQYDLQLADHVIPDSHAPVV